MHILAVEQLSKHFGGLNAVDQVSFSVNAGEIFAIIGPNGAGKTTLFNMITGIIQSSSGRIIYRGQTVTSLPSHQLAMMGIARTFQNVQLFYNLSVLENVMIGYHSRGKSGFLQSALRLPVQRIEERAFKQKAAALLELVGLAGRGDELSSNLSFGQQRLLEIARALALEPKLLLLDEPVAGLNPAESANLAVMIRQLRDTGITVLLIDHDMNTVMQLASRIMVLVYGQKIAEGCPQEIQSNEKVASAYLGDDMEEF